MSTPGDVPRLDTGSAEFTALPGFEGGFQSILYTSPDGRRLAGSFKEKGSHIMTMPFDEFIFVIAGTTSIAVTDGDSFTLGAGQCCYLREGQEVSFEMSDDFHDVVVLASDTPFDVNDLDLE